MYSVDQVKCFSESDCLSTSDYVVKKFSSSSLVESCIKSEECGDGYYLDESTKSNGAYTLCSYCSSSSSCLTCTNGTQCATCGATSAGVELYLDPLDPNFQCVQAKLCTYEVDDDKGTTGTDDDTYYMPLIGGHICVTHAQCSNENHRYEVAVDATLGYKENKACRFCVPAMQCSTCDSQDYCLTCSG